MESVTERQHLQVGVSDTPMLFPTSLWYAPVARNLSQVSSCRMGGKARRTVKATFCFQTALKGGRSF